MENVWSLFFNWMAENPIRAIVIISAVAIALCILLGFVLPARSERRKREKEQHWAEVTVRVTDNAAGDTVMNRTLYLNDKMLRHMVPGKYIDISVVPGKEDVFGIVTDIATKVVPEKSGA